MFKKMTPEGLEAPLSGLSANIRDRSRRLCHAGILLLDVGRRASQGYEEDQLVARFSQIEGYRCLSLMRAFGVVKCQWALA